MREILVGNGIIAVKKRSADATNKAVINALFIFRNSFVSSPKSWTPTVEGGKRRRQKKMGNYRSGKMERRFYRRTGEDILN